MKNLKRLLIAATVVLAALTLSCGDDDDEATATPTGVATPTATVSSPTPTAAGTPTATATETDVCGENPDPATDEQVQVDSPEPGDEVTSPLQARGLISVFEAQFNIALKDASGDDISSSSAMSSEGQTLAPFSVSLPFTVSERTPACFWVYDISEADGSIQDVYQVPVVLLP
jgi:hypothetical protein